MAPNAIQEEDEDVKPDASRLEESVSLKSSCAYFCLAYRALSSGLLDSASTEAGKLSRAEASAAQQTARWVDEVDHCPGEGDRPCVVPQRGHVILGSCAGALHAD